MEIGAFYQGGGRCLFRVWAPQHNSVGVMLFSPEKKIVPMHKEERGYWTVRLDGVRPGALYKYVMNQDQAWPDPLPSINRPECTVRPRCGTMGISPGAMPVGRERS